MFVLITFFSPKLPNIRSYKHVDIPALSLQNPYLVESKSLSTPSTTTNVTTNKPTNSQGDKTELPARRSTRIFNQPGHGFPIFGYSVTDSVIENVNQKYKNPEFDICNDTDGGLTDAMQRFIFKEGEKIYKLIPEPKTYKEAINGNQAKEWKEAIAYEFAKLNELSVFDIVTDKNYTKCGTKWVFKVKYDKNNRAKRFRARLVAQGFT